MAIGEMFQKIVSGALAATMVMSSVPAAMGQGNVQVATTPQTPDIIIRYGSNITYDMDRVVRGIERRGVSAIAILGLEDPNCAAIIHDGEEKYRFTQDLIKNGELGSVARRLGLRKEIGSLTKSDCPILTNGD